MSAGLSTDGTLLISIGPFSHATPHVGIHLMSMCFDHLETLASPADSAAPLVSI
ncbi:MAG: hypothetical protein BJ554DRAFT_2146 [Olpidium bornovanus]|uniref:Uncharacterized protein n=1 Tax=Olpidium bornovanus TaxID=278681 RepID=A0A8H8DGW3_9FUNG|nr:MAG: hypothetical protein BJ554DRAFT_2146 [Olpidium bornovanus]